MINEKTLTAKAILMVVTGILAAGFLFAPSALFAQGTGAMQAKTVPQGVTRMSITDQEIELLRQDIRTQRRQIVAANLPLTTEESAKFWPVYDQYIAETIKINDQRYALIKDYATNYNSMPDAKAAELIRKMSDVDKAMIDLRMKYMPIIEKILPERKSAMFFQIDRRVQLMIDIELASQMPLISPQK